MDKNTAAAGDTSAADSREANRSNLDDASAYYELGHGYTMSLEQLHDGKYRDAVPTASAGGRPVVVLPPATNGYRPELVDKSPDEMAQILEREDVARDEHFDVEREMRKAPGGRVQGSHSGSSRSPKKPRPPVDHTKCSIVDIEKDAHYRPHTISGRVCTAARQGFAQQATSIGEMIDVLGETLQVGVPWTRIEYVLRGMANEQRIA